MVVGQDVTSEELESLERVKEEMKSRGNDVQVVSLWMNTLYHIEDLPFMPSLGDMPNVFTPFRHKVEKSCKIRPATSPPKKGSLPLPVGHSSTFPLECCSFRTMPSLSQLGFNDDRDDDPRGVLKFRGGEKQALARVKQYIWDEDRLRRYFDTRNGMLGHGYSTKFSPWLAHGCVSPTYIAQECHRYEQERVKNKSTYWVLFELLCTSDHIFFEPSWFFKSMFIDNIFCAGRDFFRFFCLKHGKKVFHLGGITGEKRAWDNGNFGDKFRRWKEGRTGMPLVDANMREMASTGFMSNRGRQNVASYLVHDLGVDWRRGADVFESLLIDYGLLHLDEIKEGASL